MITAQAPFAALAARLTAKAEAIGKARAASRALKGRHWRDARLVWPFFGQG